MIWLSSSHTRTNLVLSPKHYFEWSSLNELAEGLGRFFRDFLFSALQCTVFYFSNIFLIGFISTHRCIAVVYTRDKCLSYCFWSILLTSGKSAAGLRRMLIAPTTLAYVRKWPAVQNWWPCSIMIGAIWRLQLLLPSSPYNHRLGCVESVFVNVTVWMDMTNDFCS